MEPGHYAAARGMARAAERVAHAARGIVDVTMDTSNRLDGAVSATSSLEEVSAGPSSVRDLDHSFQDLMMGDHGYRANLRTAQATDAQLEQLLDMVLPGGYSRLVSRPGD